MEWVLWSFHLVLLLLLPPQGVDSSHSSPAWSPCSFDGTVSTVNFSNLTPSHTLQFFMNCSMGPLHSVQSFRNRLSSVGPLQGNKSCRKTYSRTHSFLLGATGPAGTCSRVGFPWGHNLLQASTWSIVGSFMGCKWNSILHHGPPWAAQGQPDSPGSAPGSEKDFLLWYLEHLLLLHWPWCVRANIYYHTPGEITIAEQLSPFFTQLCHRPYHSCWWAWPRTAAGPPWSWPALAFWTQGKLVTASHRATPVDLMLLKPGHTKKTCTAIHVAGRKLFLSMIETTCFTKEFVFLFYLLCKQDIIYSVYLGWHPKMCRLLRPLDFSRSDQTEGNRSSSSLAEPSCLLWHCYRILKKQIFLACGQVVRIPYRTHFWLSRLKLFLSQG